MYIVFINCDLFPFISWIISGKKLFETRNRNTLKSLIGKTVYLAETGKGKRPVIRCIATIESSIVVQDMKTYNQYRKFTMVKKGSVFDFIPGKRKILYKLSNVQQIPAFVPCEGKRYGYSYMEYNGKQN